MLNSERDLTNWFLILSGNFQEYNIAYLYGLSHVSQKFISFQEFFSSFFMPTAPHLGKHSSHQIISLYSRELPQSKMCYVTFLLLPSTTYTVLLSSAKKKKKRKENQKRWENYRYFSIQIDLELRYGYNSFFLNRVISTYGKFVIIFFGLFNFEVVFSCFFFFFLLFLHLLHSMNRVINIRNCINILKYIPAHFIKLLKFLCTSFYFQTLLIRHLCR